MKDPREMTEWDDLCEEETDEETEEMNEGATTPTETFYDFGLVAGYGDAAVERYIERRRREFYREWDEYLSRDDYD